VRVGEVRVSYVLDGLVQMNPEWLGGSAPREAAAGAGCLDDEGYLVGSIGALLIERGDRRMLIDAGFGSHHVPAHVTSSAFGRIEGGRLADSLGQLGVAAHQIEAVAFTHLHDDHVGWAVQRTATGDVPFAHARYHVGAPEWASWRGRGDPGKVALFDERLDTVKDGQEIFPGVTAWSTPGHTPGHLAYVVESGGERLIAFGDVMHSPIQFAETQWSAANDHDRTQAVASRRAVVDELAGGRVIGFGGHFADVVFGRVVERRWQPVA
jgi:glyoxylase-like metal-dependent hydrolase (beta-lactamase superfamily II)